MMEGEGGMRLYLYFGLEGFSRILSFPASLLFLTMLEENWESDEMSLREEFKNRLAYNLKVNQIYKIVSCPSQLVTRHQSPILVRDRFGLVQGC